MKFVRSTFLGLWKEVMGGLNLVFVLDSVLVHNNAGMLNYIATSCIIRSL